MQIIQPGLIAEGDEELAVISVRPRIRHRKDASLIMAQAGRKFVGKSIARVAFCRLVGIAALNHETRHNAVPLQTVIVGLAFFRSQRALRQTDEIRHGHRRFAVEQHRSDDSVDRGELSVNSISEFAL